MTTITGYSPTTGTPLITMYVSNNPTEINDKIEHLETYYPELVIKVQKP